MTALAIPSFRSIAEHSRISIPVMLRQSPTVEGNVGLVRQSASRFRRRGQKIEDTDQYSDGLMGLWKAVQTYRIECGAFSTWATQCINNAIYQGERSRGRLKRRLNVVPTNELNIATEPQRFVIDIVRKFLAKHKDDTSIDLRNKSILKKHFIDGESWSDIGRKFGFTRQNAMLCGHEAMRLIRLRHSAELMEIED